MGCYSLLQGLFPTQGSNPGLLHCRCISLPSKPPIVFCKCDGATHFFFFTLQASLWDFGYLAACGGIHMQLLQGFQFFLCIHRSYSSGFRIFVQDTSFVPILGTRVLPYQDSCLLAFHVCMISFSIFVTVHADPCAQAPPHEAMRVPQPLLPPL